jgi:ariadne-1
VLHTWDTITDHSCGRYKGEAEQKVDNAQGKHQRYMHYIERWKNHMDSLVKERKERCDQVVMSEVVVWNE